MPRPVNAEEAEVEQFYEDLQDLLETTHKKDVLFIIGVWNAVLSCNGKNYRIISVHFQGKPFNITVIRVLPKPLMLNKLKLNDSLKTNKIF